MILKLVTDDGVVTVYNLNSQKHKLRVMLSDETWRGRGAFIELDAKDAGKLIAALMAVKATLDEE